MSFVVVKVVLEAEARRRSHVIPHSGSICVCWEFYFRAPLGARPSSTTARTKKGFSFLVVGISKKRSLFVARFFRVIMGHRKFAYRQSMM